ncbi:hypothetical protein EM6_2947 [Asticcacaulis excentricus]|uniref:Uncharacterized protein n=1 Tax=Asticcacaulis excentricus TaxID=78587 RepID=A0A3G9G8H1_9CAUL|nr:hypothetical protein EM6_2947 [Asticcacaulis excentricus]
MWGCMGHRGIKRKDAGKRLILFRRLIPNFRSDLIPTAEDAQRIRPLKTRD